MNTEKTYNYEKDYVPYIIKWGRRTNWTGVLLSFGPAFVLAVVYGIVPPFNAILQGFIAIASAVGIIWFVEPISFFPVIGITGTYMAFISGNISNLRIPCAMIAQKIAGVEPGTKEGGIIATLGIAVSIVVNLVILSAGVFAGVQVLQQLPPGVVRGLQFLVPSLFGSIFMQFAIRKLKLAPIVLFLAILVALGVSAGFIPRFLSTLSVVFLSVFLGVFLHKKGVV